MCEQRVWWVRNRRTMKKMIRKICAAATECAVGVSLLLPALRCLCWFGMHSKYQLKQRTQQYQPQLHWTELSMAFNQIEIVIVTIVRHAPTSCSPLIISNIHTKRTGCGMQENNGVSVTVDGSCLATVNTNRTHNYYANGRRSQQKSNEWP